MNKSSLKAGFSWTLAGNATYAFSQWAIFVMLAKLGTAEQLGHYALGMAVSSPVFLLTNMNLRAAQATDVRGGYPFESYFALRLLSSLLAAGVAGGIGVWIADGPAALSIILLAVAVKFADSLHDVIYGFLQQRELMRPIAISMMARGVASLIVVFCGLYFFDRLDVALVGVVGAWVVILLAVDVRHKLHLEPFHWRRGRALDMHLLSVVVPLGFIAALDSLNVNIPKYILQGKLGAVEVGHYTALATLVMTGGIILSALGNTALPRIASLHERGDIRALRSLIGKLIGLSVLVGTAGIIGSVAFGEPLLRVIYNEDIAQRADSFVILMAVAAVWYCVTILGFCLYAMRLFREQLPLYVAMDLMTTLAALALVPRFGITGGVLAFGAGIVTRAGLSAALFRKGMRALRKVPNAV